MSAKGHKVYWSPDEAIRVVERATELLAASPDLPRHVAVSRAQEALLPAERWRRFKQVRDTERLLTGTLSRSHPPPEPFDDAAPAASVATSQRPFPRAILPPLELPSHYENPPVSPVTPPAVDPAIVKAVAEQLMPALAATFSECVVRLSDVLADVIRTASTPAVQPRDVEHSGPDAQPVPVPPRTRLPRVTVVGLIHQQERDVEQAFAGVIDFVFVKAQKTGGGGHGGAGMLTRSASSDLVLAMTDFIGHDVEASSRHLHVPFRRVTGSVSALKRWLTDWLATGVTP